MHNYWLMTSISSVMSFFSYICFCLFTNLAASKSLSRSVSPTVVNQERDEVESYRGLLVEDEMTLREGKLSVVNILLS